jgi:hypothetical protein
MMYGTEVSAFSLIISNTNFESVIIACLVRDNNKDHRRMEALVALAKPEYREDVISNNLRDFIIQGKFQIGVCELYL